MSAPSKTWPMSAWIAAGPGDLDVDPVRGVLAQLVAQGLDLVDVVGGRRRRHRDRGEGGGAVLGHDDGAGLLAAAGWPPLGWPPVGRPGHLLGRPAPGRAVDGLLVEVLRGRLVDLPRPAVHSTIATCPSSSGSWSASSTARVLSAPAGSVSVGLLSRVPSGTKAMTARARRIGTRATSQAVRRP